MNNILSFDVEEWNDDFRLSDETRMKLPFKENHIKFCLQKILIILKANNVHATFFVVGRIAENNVELIKMIVADGHEVASHGYSHKPLYLFSPEEFKEDLLCSIRVLKTISGQEIFGYRAPGYTINREKMWAIDIIKECGLLYDSSIYPVSMSLFSDGGVSGYPQGAFRFKNGLNELPLATINVFGLKLPVATTSYFRIFPYIVTKKAINWLNRRSIIATLNFHTWEFDSDIPRIGLPFPYNIKRYHNLSKTESRFKQLIKDFNFINCKEAILGSQ